MRYFSSRKEAGQLLAERLHDYQYEKTIVLALSVGGVLVGAQIAKRLHCLLTMLLTEEIVIPGENSIVGTVDQSGGFTYNRMLSTGELEYYTSEYHSVIEDEKREKFHELNHILGEGGLLPREALRGHNVILVEDASKNGIAFDTAADFLKFIKVQKIISAVPVASIGAVDRLHIISDEIHCLSVTENFFDPNHYYEDNNLPKREEVIAIINNIVQNWQ